VPTSVAFHPDPKEAQDLRALKVSQGRRVLQGHKEYKALRDRQAHLGRRVPKALLAHKVHKVHKENRGRKAL
jgi:hypothetical protein